MMLKSADDTWARRRAATGDATAQMALATRYYCVGWLGYARRYTTRVLRRYLMRDSCSPCTSKGWMAQTPSLPLLE
jgi:hypothetical protein